MSSNSLSLTNVKDAIYNNLYLINDDGGVDNIRDLLSVAGADVSGILAELNKKPPKLNKNVISVVGWVQDTLEPFLTKHKPEINFVHLDLDTYESTKFVLTKIKPYIVKNCIIAFDELYNFDGWEVGEYKALKETFNDKEYRFICFCLNGEQAAIQII